MLFLFWQGKEKTGKESNKKYVNNLKRKDDEK